MFGGFQLNNMFVPANYLIADISIDEERHLVFSTGQQLDLLAKAKSWFMGGTFKVVKEPFAQLFSIHAMVRQAECIKSVPLAFAVMSRRRSADYVKVRISLLYVIKNTTFVKIIFILSEVPTDID